MTRTPKIEKNDVDIFFPIPETILTVEGEEIGVPKVSWGKEQVLVRMLGKLLQKFPFDEFIDREKQEVKFDLLFEKLLRVLPELLGDAVDVTTEGVAFILGQEEEWVNEHLEMEGVLGVAVPFFGNCFLKGWKISRRFGLNLGPPEEEGEPETS